MNYFEVPKFEIEFCFQHNPLRVWKLSVRAENEEAALQQFHKEYSQDRVHVEAITTK